MQLFVQVRDIRVTAIHGEGVLRQIVRTDGDEIEHRQQRVQNQGR